MAKKVKAKVKPTKDLAVTPEVTLGISIYRPSVEKLLHKKTPPEFIDKHPFNGLNYVQVGYVRRCIDDYCKANEGTTWTFEVNEVASGESLLKIKHVVVKGTLTILFSDGTFMSREQFGGATVKFYKSTHKSMPGLPMDLGNDYKSAASDALKKCASLLGIAQDVFEPKVEAKVQAYDKAHAKDEDTVSVEQVAEVLGGKVISSVTQSGLASNGYAERIGAEKIGMVGKMLYDTKHGADVKAYMKKTFGFTLASKLNVEQYNTLMSWAMKEHKEVVPF